MTAPRDDGRTRADGDGPLWADVEAVTLRDDTVLTVGASATRPAVLLVKLAACGALFLCSASVLYGSLPLHVIAWLAPLWPLWPVGLVVCLALSTLAFFRLTVVRSVVVLAVLGLWFAASGWTFPRTASFRGSVKSLGLFDGWAIEDVEPWLGLGDLINVRWWDLRETDQEDFIYGNLASPGRASLRVWFDVDGRAGYVGSFGIDRNVLPEPFDPQRWAVTPREARHGMAVALAEGRRLRGLTEQEVVAQLGPPDGSVKEYYTVGTLSSSITIPLDEALCVDWSQRR